MIERHDEILAEYTDEYLIAFRERGDGQREYANRLLQAPPEYRQGIEIRTISLAERTWIHNGLAKMTPTGVGWDNARNQALLELARQGVTLLPVPA